MTLMLITVSVIMNKGADRSKSDLLISSSSTDSSCILQSTAFPALNKPPRTASNISTTLCSFIKMTESWASTIFSGFVGMYGMGVVPGAITGTDLSVSVLPLSVMRHTNSTEAT